jgi:hypothetical protein
MIFGVWGVLLKIAVPFFNLRKKEEAKRKTGYFTKRKREIKGGRISVHVHQVYFISSSPVGRWRNQRADSEDEGWNWGIKLSDN